MNPTPILRRILAGSTLLLAASQALADFQGTSSGIFTNPVGVPGYLVTTGAGTSNFTWGDGVSVNNPPSSLSFAGSSFSTPAETLFQVGTLYYHNGTTAYGTEASAVDLLLNLSFSNPSGITKTFAYNLNLINVVNVIGDPVASADYVSLPSVANTTFTDGIDVYTLNLQFGSFSGSSFGGPNEFRVPEGQSASVQILGNITTNLAGVPDTGSTLALFALALAGLGYARRQAVA